MDRNEMREALADYAHEAWAGWMRYMLSKCEYVPGAGEAGYGVLLMPVALYDRWTRQMNTSYVDLPENEKASDRKEADEILEIVGQRADGWIAVDEALPEFCYDDGGGVQCSQEIIATNGAWVGTAIYANLNRWFFADGEGVQVYSITHWRPLPEPPGT